MAHKVCILNQMVLKDYQAELRRFVSGQYLYTGFRVTACVIIPAWLLYHFGLLSTMVSIPLGALFVGLTDNPGPVHHRRNGMLVSSVLNFIVVLVAGLSRFSSWLIGIENNIFSELPVQSFLFLVPGAGSIGLTALIIFLLLTQMLCCREISCCLHFIICFGGLWYLRL